MELKTFRAIDYPVVSASQRNGDSAGAAKTGGSLFLIFNFNSSEKIKVNCWNFKSFVTPINYLSQLNSTY